MEEVRGRPEQDQFVVAPALVTVRRTSRRMASPPGPVIENHAVEEARRGPCRVIERDALLDAPCVDVVLVIAG